MIEQEKYLYKKIDHLISYMNKNNDYIEDKLSKSITNFEFEQLKKYGEDLEKNFKLYKNENKNKVINSMMSLSYLYNKMYYLIKEIELEKITDDDNTIFI